VLISLAELETSLAELETSLAELETSLAKLETSLAELQMSLAELETVVASLSSSEGLGKPAVVSWSSLWWVASWWLLLSFSNERCVRFAIMELDGGFLFVMVLLQKKKQCDGSIVAYILSKTGYFYVFVGLGDSH
jgi:exonuclease VII small subunit